MVKLIAFVLATVGLVWVSRRSLRAPGSHGCYRFIAWELILALFLINVDSWFRNPFSWHQLISWVLLTASIFPVVMGVRSLAGQGKPAEHREGAAHLLAFEKTTTVVSTGIYRYIRHPLYSSLLFLAWGIFFKVPTWMGACLAVGATLALLATARADEAECLRFFGAEYVAYMAQTKRFVPFLF
ncbi:MAG: methyltransferase [Anaerolineae bacterium]|jgi:protein-S-isoprenylcysteine O-methyltransferase Ste14